MTRFAWMLGAALLGTGVVSLAEAQTCESDEDCGKGTWCRSEGGNDVAVGMPACDSRSGDCEGQKPAPTLTLTCQKLPTGVCESQGDCAEGLTCVIEPAWSGCNDGPATEPGAAPSDIAKQNCVPEEITVRYGYCALAATPCTSDSDCLSGLTCGDEESGGAKQPSTGTSSGGGTTPVSPGTGGSIDKQATRTCGFSVTKCETTADCPGNYGCMEVVVGGECSGGTGTACPSDGPCEQPAEPPEQQQCRDITEKQCVPTEMPCTVDENCPNDWRCVSFSDDLPAPEPWGLEGVGQRCLPEGIALYIQSQRGAHAASDSAGGGKGQPTQSGADEDGEESLKPPATGNGKSTCSVGLAAPGSESSLVLLLGALAWIGRRRRAA